MYLLEFSNILPRNMPENVMVACEKVCKAFFLPYGGENKYVKIFGISK